jgi:type II secretory pathway pseudopilin PulG
MKKGAMFGLDARIALAIFGALSVISGAALYSAIQSAKAESARQVFNEMVKASEAYYLDNGTPLPQKSGSPSSLVTNDLRKNRESLSTWGGPYITDAIDYSVSDDSKIKNSFTLGIASDAYMDIVLQKDIGAVGTCSVGSTDCAEYVRVYPGNVADNIPTLKAYFDMLDALVDNSDGETSGRVKWRGSPMNSLYYKGIPRKRIN